ncbi:MAG: aminotransferase class I/II-fold pyridoxal phosphate-dependent enzyme, partial [Methylobacteriaceae bacterium]|nr:aminotransferase class I/II-fold pyridoxal phosphate-dependent enzyme [Methylobacteriaceae bacterium]
GHVCEALHRIRGPFNVNGAALEAGIAALADAAHVEKSVAHNEAWLPWLTQEIEKLGLVATPSVGNFILIHFPGDSGRSAAAADEFLTRQGLVLRGVAGYGLADCLRMTVGTEEANRLVVAKLAEFIQRGARNGA